MGDNLNSGDAVTQTSTGYSLKQMFMFIGCIIMNIVMFNFDLNIHMHMDCLTHYNIEMSTKLWN
jgi:hypothetical protein